MATMENHNQSLANFDIHMEDLVDGGFTRASILIDENLHMKVFINKGQVPEFDHLFLALLGHPDGYRAIARALQFKRVHPYKIEVREGFSGCKDYKLISAKKINGVYRKEVKAKLHISMYDKVNGNELEEGMFLPDLLEFLFEDGPDFFEDTIKYMVSGKSDYGFKASIRFMRNLQKKCFGRKFEYNRPSIETFLKKEDGWKFD